MVRLIVYVVLISLRNVCDEHGWGIPFMLVQQQQKNRQASVANSLLSGLLNFVLSEN